jgi:hypothetical protein
MKPLTRAFEVVAKGVKGKDRVPFVRLRSPDGETLELYFLDKAAMEQFKVSMVIDVQVVRRQQQLG